VHLSDLSTKERDTLHRVEQGAFDGATSEPSELRALIGRGLVETSPLITLPVMPTRYRYTLSLLGKQLLASDRANH